jgi:hypothetical protein
MKTQILQLEPHDDVISTRDKMGWTQTSRILLVWPPRGRVLTRRLDLELILRHSRALGAQLALVTTDPDVRYHAKVLGIHVFKHVRQAQNKRWQRPYQPSQRLLRALNPRKNKITSPPDRQEDPNRFSLPVRLGLFSLGVLALLSIAAVLLPSAEIQLIPKNENQTIDVPVQASLEVDRVNPSGLVPIQLVSVIVEGRDSLTPTGSIDVPEKRAKGEVRFTNLTDEEVEVPANTVVSTGGSSLRFTTDRAGRITAGAGETADIAITAMAPGSHSNLSAGMIKAIEGPLGLSLTVTNLIPTSGGSNHTSPAPTPLDRTRLYSHLIATLVDTARLEIQNGLGIDDVLLTPTPKQVNILQEVYEPPEEQPANQLDLTMRVEFLAMVVRGEDLRQLAEAALDANVPVGYSSQTGSLKIDHRGEPILENNSTATWNMEASRALRANLEQPRAVSMVMGLEPAQAERRLSDGLPLEESPRINLTPAWWPRLPFLPFRIHVLTNNGG